jgi:hypothetical protein
MTDTVTTPAVPATPPVVSKDFVLGGKATLTLAIPAAFAEEKGINPHYTFKVAHKAATAEWPESYFVSLLTGPDNWANYTYAGKLDPATGEVKATKKSCLQQDSLPLRLLNRALGLVWGGDTTPLTDAGFGLHHAGKCARCGRKLTVPASILTGFGPECAGRS